MRGSLFLGPHTDSFNFADEQNRTAAEGVLDWIHPEEYRRFVASKKREFQDEVDLELGAPKPAPK